MIIDGDRGPALGIILAIDIDEELPAHGPFSSASLLIAL
jgi:hypothetical protein